MANFSQFFPTLLKHEGGFVNDPNDKGGATNLGVTFAVWLKNGYDKDGDGDIDVNDLKKITPVDAQFIAKKLYWDKVAGDQIKSQSVAEFIFDFAYNSGPAKAIKKTQEAIPGLVADGVIGPKTIAAINAQDPKTLFNKLKASREAYFRAIVAGNPSQAKFLKGWLNRNNSFTFKS